MRSDTFRKVREIVPPPPVEGRQPPHDLDAEAAVISAISVDGTGRVLDQVADFLKPEHFYAEAHRRIYEACQALYAEGKPTDTVTIMAWLKDRDRLSQVGGAGYLTEIINATPAIANVTEHARIVHGKAKARLVIAACQHTAALGYVDYGTAQDFAAEAAEKLHTIAHEDLPNTTSPIKALIKDFARATMASASSGRTVAGTPTGFHRFDRMTAGLHDGDLTIFAARPGMGKTSFVLDVAVNVATGAPADDIEPLAVVVFSLEMPSKQVVARMTCSRGRIDLGRLRANALTPADFTRFNQATLDLAQLPIWIDDQASLSLLDMRARIRRIQSELARTPLNGADGKPLLDASGKTRFRKLGLAAVDYLQLMKGTADSREQEISGLSRGLKALAKELSLPVIALSQLNRKAEERTGHMPQLSDLRESGAIEQDADNIVFIYRDEYYAKDKSEEKGTAELVIAKQRNGPTGNVKVRFDREYTRFDNIKDWDGGDEAEGA